LPSFLDGPHGRDFPLAEPANLRLLPDAFGAEWTLAVSFGFVEQEQPGEDRPEYGPAGEANEGTVPLAAVDDGPDHPADAAPEQENGECIVRNGAPNDDPDPSTDEGHEQE
jgi:hypothetical protein